MPITPGLVTFGCCIHIVRVFTVVGEPAAGNVCPRTWLIDGCDEKRSTHADRCINTKRIRFRSVHSDEVQLRTERHYSLIICLLAAPQTKTPGLSHEGRTPKPRTIRSDWKLARCKSKKLVTTRAAGRLKFLILVNLEIDRKKNRQCISITNHSTCHFAQEKNNHISNGLCSYALIYSYYRSSQLFRHTS